MKTLFQEIDSLQKEINSYRPLGSNLLKQIREYYKIGLTYSSNALEGNTLSESETKIILEEGITIGGKPIKDHFEAVGHAEAYDFLFTIFQNKSIQEKDIKEIHKLIYYRIDEKNAGKYRKNKAVITGSKYPLPKPPKFLIFIISIQKPIERSIRDWASAGVVRMLERPLKTLMANLKNSGQNLSD